MKKKKIMEPRRMNTRSRSQQAMKELSKRRKTRWLPARINVRNRVSKDANLGVVNEEDDDDDIQVVDESEYLRRIAVLKLNSVKQNTSVKRNQNLGKDDDCEHANDCDCNKEQGLDNDDNREHIVGHDHNKELEVGLVDNVELEVGLVDNEELEVGHDDNMGLEVGHDDNKGLEVGHDDNKGREVGHDDNKELEVGHDDNMELEVGHDDNMEQEVGHVDNKQHAVGHDDTKERELGLVDNEELEVGRDDNKQHVVGHDDTKELEVGHDDTKEPKVDRDDNKEREVSHADITKGYKSDEGSDDSLQILGEKWDSGDSDDSHSSVTSSDSDSDTTCTHRTAEPQVGCSSGIKSRLSKGDGLEISEKNGLKGVYSEGNNGFVCDSDSNRSKGKYRPSEKKSETACNGEFFGKRKYDGLVLSVKPENNAPEDDFVGRRTRSHRRRKLPRKKRGDGTLSHPLAIDDESLSSSDGGYEVKNNFCYKNMCHENGTVRKRARPHKRAYIEATSESETDSEAEIDLKPEIDPMPVINLMPENNFKPVPVINPIPENNSKPKNDYKPDIDPIPVINPMPENNSKPKSDYKPDIEPMPVISRMLENNFELKKNFKPVPVINPMPEKKSKPKSDYKPDIDHIPLINRMPKNNPIPEKPKNDSKLVDKTVCEDVIKRKRGRPRKNNILDKYLRPEKKKKRLESSNEVENTLLSSILESGNVGVEDTPVALTSAANLELKFSFCVQNSLPSKSEKKDEVERLFDELDFALRACDVGCSISSSLDESEEDVDDDDVVSYSSAVVQAKLCSQGKHYFILDDEIGFMCKVCSFVKLDIRNVIPAFDVNPFGKSGNNRYPWRYYDEYLAAVSNGSDNLELQYNREHFHSDNTKGTVWDLVPGIKPSLYPHQQEAFEFIWKNVGGTKNLDELGKSSKHSIGGCIICHAPGTGKTRLAITFLQSFLRKYPASRPVIIAPTSMLLTWEEEFARWNVDVPFHNLNKPELSGREDREVVKRSGNIRDMRNIRIAKLCSWVNGKGIVGISYRLFEELAGERKSTDKSIKQALLEQPGIVILDEGHTPRNNDSNIYNVLMQVKTKRRIILSGTPFQNNFQELHNTLSLVQEEFRNPHLLGGYVNDDTRIAELRKRMKPYVHVHKGEILKKTLRGLFHSVLVLKPSDFQKTCVEKLGAVKSIMEYNHLVSVACVHPSLLANCKQVPKTIDKGLLKNCKENIEFGLKIKFLLELINLAVGEKVLVFNQYIVPLDYIADLLKTRFHWTEGKEFLYMKGQQDTKQRQSSINLFNDPSSKVRVLLASTKACGEGIHLVGASRVVLLDVVWNPSVERQAISRAYRIGQKKDVFVYHLILSGTLEEEKYYRSINKDRLSEMVFCSEGEGSPTTSSMVSQVSEDRILDEMVQNEKTNSMFTKIRKSNAADELIKTFNPLK